MATKLKWKVFTNVIKMPSQEARVRKTKCLIKNERKRNLIRTGVDKLV